MMGRDESSQRFYILASMKFFTALFISTLLLAGCSSIPARTADSVPIASIPSPTILPSTPVLEQDLVPIPTNIQLPFNPNAGGDEYCKPPNAILPAADSNDISENEIVHELLNIWLRRYIQPNTPSICRIADYTIDKVDEDPSVYSETLEPRGDFMRTVSFSVKLTQIPSDWMGFSGELDQDNWLHVTHIVAITKTGDGYKMDFAYP